MVKQERPQWIRNFLADQDLSRIQAAVEAAERVTSGEIVPMIVRRSRTDSLLSFLVAALMLLVAVTWKLYGPLELRLEDRPELWLGIYVLAALSGFALGTVSAVQRFLVPRWEQRQAVEQRALLEFYLARLQDTEARTGILLFVSLAERQAVVLADKGISQHTAPGFFDAVVQDLISGAKSGRMAEGFQGAIERCAGLLAQHFPPRAEDRNELCDALRIKD